MTVVCAWEGMGSDSRCVRGRVLGGSPTNYLILLRIKDTI